MTSWAMFVCLPLVLAAGDEGIGYSEAHRMTVETKKPLLVLVGAQWCGPCKQLKTEVLPQLRQRAVFRKVVFTQVDVDRESELARQITGGGPVPQIVLYRNTGEGWVRRKLVGVQSVERLEQFINENLQSDPSGDSGERDERQTALRSERDRQQG